MLWTFGALTCLLSFIKQAVRRNRGRFPEDFLFVLTRNETDALVSQSVIPGHGKFGGAAPYAFTEHGALMWDCVVGRSRKASWAETALPLTDEACVRKCL
jgi:hypothetical protein